MQAALAAIVAAGGEAHPEGGGYWASREGVRLRFDPTMGTGGDVVTNTVMALVGRGFLQAIPNSGGRVYSAYRVTVPVPRR